MSIKNNGRTLVNAIGIPSILIFTWLGGIYFTIFIAGIIMLALHEFYGLYRSNGIFPSYILGLIGTGFFIWFYYYEPYLNMLGFIQLLSIFIILLLTIALFSNKVNPIGNAAYTIIGIAYIPLLLGSLIAIRQFDQTYSTYFTFALFISIWVCDSIAFCAGLKWGAKKIFHRVSPNKTWIGSIIGFVSTIIFFGILYYFDLPSVDFSLEGVIVLSIISGVFGQLGDFVESLLKRSADVKDSGKILLGHGGVLDRFDSLVFAAPLTYFYLLF